jgi:hypothetical protein
MHRLVVRSSIPQFVNSLAPRDFDHMLAYEAGQSRYWPALDHGMFNVNTSIVLMASLLVKQHLRDCFRLQKGAKMHGRYQQTLTAALFS